MISIKNITGAVDFWIKYGSSLRHKQRDILTKADKDIIDEALRRTRKVLLNVDCLLESVRVDQETKNGRIGVVTRGLFVFRDSPKMAEKLPSLAIVLGILNISVSRLGRTDECGPNDRLPQITTSYQPPPSYEHSQLSTQKGELGSHKESYHGHDGDFYKDYYQDGNGGDDFQIMNPFKNVISVVLSTKNDGPWMFSMRL